LQRVFPARKGINWRLKKVTIINKIKFGEKEYSLNKIIKILKEKGKYYKCRVCGRKYVKKEGELCKNCRYFAGLKYVEKDSELSENTKR